MYGDLGRFLSSLLAGTGYSHTHASSNNGSIEAFDFYRIQNTVCQVITRGLNRYEVLRARQEGIPNNVTIRMAREEADIITGINAEPPIHLHQNQADYFEAVKYILC